MAKGHFPEQKLGAKSQPPKGIDDPKAVFVDFNRDTSEKFDLGKAYRKVKGGLKK